jgi:hypothetical protein
LAKAQDQKIYLSGSGADEIFSDYGFNGVKFYNHSTIGGHFPDDLSTVFPWKNFFRNTQRAYLMKEEHVAGAYGIEGRYPFLDKQVVQEFLWLSADLKNSEYKSPLAFYLKTNNFPFEENQKTGFGCGFSGPSSTGTEYDVLSQDVIKDRTTNKVTNRVASRIVDFDKLINKKNKSNEDFCVIKPDNITHVSGYMYKATIRINYPGFRYYNKSRFTLQEDDVPLLTPLTSYDSIATEGLGKYCFWLSNTVYFSTSDNTDPLTNNRSYSIIKLRGKATQE